MKWANEWIKWMCGVDVDRREKYYNRALWQKHNSRTITCTALCKKKQGTNGTELNRHRTEQNRMERRRTYKPFIPFGFSLFDKRGLTDSLYSVYSIAYWTMYNNKIQFVHEVVRLHVGLVNNSSKTVWNMFFAAEIAAVACLAVSLEFICTFTRLPFLGLLLHVCLCAFYIVFSMSVCLFALKSLFMQQNYRFCCALCCCWFFAYRDL